MRKSAVWRAVLKQDVVMQDVVEAVMRRPELEEGLERRKLEREWKQRPERVLQAQRRRERERVRAQRQRELQAELHAERERELVPVPEWEPEPERERWQEWWEWWEQEREREREDAKRLWMLEWARGLAQIPLVLGPRKTVSSRQMDFVTSLLHRLIFLI
jgi:hypothetical protein